MSTMTIRFEGLCCHIDPTGSGIAAKRRAVLVDASGPPHVHISYIEVFADDFDPAMNPGWTLKSYPRHGVDYARAEVKNVKVELTNPIQSATFTILPSFHQRIPKLREVEPSFTVIDPDLLSPIMPPNKVAAYFDMSAGVLASGPSESFRTEFQPPKSWPTKHLGEWAQLEMEIDDTIEPTVRVTDLSTGATKDLKLKPGTDLITIGNQMETDIVGIRPSPTQPGHFGVYYGMAASPLTDRPQPRRSAGLGTGCSNSSYP